VFCAVVGVSKIAYQPKKSPQLRAFLMFY